MIGLAIHTSSPELGLALCDDQGTLRQQTWPLGRDLTAYLHTALAEFIAPYTWADLTYLAVAKGPGGFTGTRIGVVAARTLAQQLEIPLFGISSLAAAAESLRHALPHHSIAVEMRAQRGELYGALYELTDTDLICHLPDQVFAQAAWQQQLQDWSTPYHLETLEGGLAHTVASVLTLAQRQWQQGKRPHWGTVEPYYGQHPVQSANA